MTTTPPSSIFRQPPRSTLIWRYLRRNKSLLVGIALLLGLALFATVGSLTIDLAKKAYPLAVKPKQPPDLLCIFNRDPVAQKTCYPLGTDFYGRDLLAAMVRGVIVTAQIGGLAGLIGTLIGIVLGFVSAYYGGTIDTIVRGLTEVLLPIPVFLIQVLVFASIDKKLIANYPILIMASVVALLAWMGPTRVVRAQVLSMKERQFVSVARLSGMNNFEIIFKEIMPNLLPFIIAAFVGQVFTAIFASFGISAAGLGPLREPLMGNTIYFAQAQGALFNGWWWWILWPILTLMIIFGALTLVNIGLDEVANPRLRRSE